jgi:hypothetical protein
LARRKWEANRCILLHLLLGFAVDLGSEQHDEHRQPTVRAQAAEIRRLSVEGLTNAETARRLGKSSRRARDPRKVL